MARKRHSHEGCLMLLREIELQLAFGWAICLCVGLSGSAIRRSTRGVRSSAA